MKQTFMENGRTSVENRGGMKEEGTVGGPAGTGKKRSHRLPEAAEVDRNLPIQVAAVCDTTGKLHPLWFRYADTDRRVRRVEIAVVLTERTIRYVGLQIEQYICSSVIEGRKRTYELRYSVEDHRWYFFRMLD